VENALRRAGSASLESRTGAVSGGAEDSPSCAGHDGDYPAG